MEPAQEQQTRQLPPQQEQPRQQGRHLQASSAGDTTARLADNEAFDSVRHAALVMFKQRTKDLTQLANVEAQSQVIEAELQKAQTSVAQLASQHATLEALVEEEQQRLRQREGRLTELHGALVQGDEEQRAYKKLQHAAEAAIDAATTFIARSTGSEGRLFELLALAKERVGGRSARDLQGVVAHIQQRLAEATEHQQRLLAGPFSFDSEAPSHIPLALPALTEGGGEEGRATDVVSGFRAVLEGWAMHTDAWGRHRELSAVLGALRDLEKWIAADDVEEEGELPLARLPLPPSSRLSTDAFVEAEERQLQTWIEEHVVTPLQILRRAFDSLSDACATHQVQFPAKVTAMFTSLEARAVAEWVALQTDRQQWVASAKEAEAAADLASAALLARQTARTEQQTLAEACATLDEAYLRRQADLQSGKAAELQNYAAAWQKGWRTVAAQRASLQAVQQAVESRGGEAADVEARAQQEAQTHAEELAAQATSLAAQQAVLTAAQEQLAEAAAQKAVLTEELAAAQQTERDAQHCLDDLLSAAQQRAASAEAPCTVSLGQLEGDTLAGVRGSAAAALQSVAGCPEIYAEWASVIDRQRGRLVDDDESSAFLDALCYASEPADGVSDGGPLSMAPLRAALLQIATTLQLPVQLFQPEVLTDELLNEISCLGALGAEEQVTRATAVTHREFMAEAQAEMNLLRQEMASGE